MSPGPPRAIAGPTGTDKPTGDERPGGANMMNETVYLFALSLPDLLDRIVADRDEGRAPAVLPPSTEERS